MGYGHRVVTDGYAMDNKYFYTPATKENPHGTREELTNFDKILHRIGKLKNYVNYEIRGQKRPGEIEKEEIEEELEKILPIDNEYIAATKRMNDKFKKLNEEIEREQKERTENHKQKS